MKEHVEQYWHSPLAQRTDISLPYIVYDVYKENGTYGHTSFTITLKGSKSLLPRPRPISFQVVCISPPSTQSSTPLSTAPDKRYSIKIFRDMYETGPKCCPVIEGLGGADCSQTQLQMDGEGDKNCCTLLCEISFHLPTWQEVGCHLGMEELDIDAIKEEYGKADFYVQAFELLTSWVSSSECIPYLGTLIKALHSSSYTIMLSDWSISYNAIVPRNMDKKLMLKLAKLIRCHWKFVARFLGMRKEEIDSIDLSTHTLCDKAYEMLWEWQRHCPLGPEDAYLKLFSSVHCVSEHINKPYLKAAVKSLE